MMVRFWKGILCHHEDLGIDTIHQQYSDFPSFVCIRVRVCPVVHNFIAGRGGASTSLWGHWEHSFTARVSCLPLSNPTHSPPTLSLVPKLCQPLTLNSTLTFLSFCNCCVGGPIRYVLLAPPTPTQFPRCSRCHRSFLFIAEECPTAWVTTDAFTREGHLDKSQFGPITILSCFSSSTGWWVSGFSL